MVASVCSLRTLLLAVVTRSSRTLVVSAAGPVGRSWRRRSLTLRLGSRLAGERRQVGGRLASGFGLLLERLLHALQLRTNTKRNAKRKSVTEMRKRSAKPA